MYQLMWTLTYNLNTLLFVVHVQQVVEKELAAIGRFDGRSLMLDIDIDQTDHVGLDNLTQEQLPIQKSRYHSRY